MKKKLFVTGIGGLTGYKLALSAKEDFEVYGSYNLRNPEFDFVKSIQIDLSGFDKMEELLKQIRPDFLVNTIAISSVDYCQIHKDEAERINVDVVKKLNQISNSLGIKLIQISSDSIFDGKKKGPYREDDKPNPINFYGQTKLMSEKIVLENSENLVVRSSVLYGWHPKNLIEKPSSSRKSINFGQWLISKLKNNEKVKIVTDEISTPIIADDLAKSILHLIKGNYSGIFHCACEEQISRYEFSVKLAKFLNYNQKLIQPTTVKELGRNVLTGFNKCLDPTKMIKMTNFHFLSLEDSFMLMKNQMLTQ